MSDHPKHVDVVNVTVTGGGYGGGAKPDAAFKVNLGEQLGKERLVVFSAIEDGVVVSPCVPCVPLAPFNTWQYVAVEERGGEGRG